VSEAGEAPEQPQASPAGGGDQASTAGLEALLAERLAPTVQRERRRRLLTAWAACTAAAAVAAFFLTLAEEHLGLPARPLWLLAALALAGALVATWRWARRRTPDARAVARTIERAHPELRALLLTAVAQRPPAPGQPLGYLQEQVVREAVRLATPLAWSRAVSARRLWGTGAAAAAGALVFAYLAASVFLPDLPSLLGDEYGLSVSPGHTDVERGTNVLVLARFARKLPSRATLVVRAPGKPAARIEMSKSLEDPVFGGLTPPLAGERAEYQIEYAGHRSRRFAVTTFEYPDLARVDARIEYPGQPPKEVKDTRHLSLTEGARVTLTFFLNKPARDARLASEGKTVLTLAARQGGEVQAGTLSPTRTRSYDLHLVDQAGRANRLPPRLTIEVHANQPPQFAVTFPGRDVRVSPLEEVTLEAKIDDDVALLAHGVTYQLAAGAPREIRLGEDGKSPGHATTARALVALEDLRAQPDQLLSYHFWAEDLDAHGKRRRAASDMYFAEVRAFEERYREAPSGGGEEPAGAAGGAGSPLDDRIARQKDIINATWRIERNAREGHPLEEVRKDTATAAKAQADLRESTQGEREPMRPGAARAAALGAAVTAMDEARRQLERAAREEPLAVLPPALDAEQAAYGGLLKLRERDSNVTRGRGGGGGGGGRPQRELSGLELKQKENRYETRREAASPAEQQGRGDREVMGRLQELARRQKALTERIKELEAALKEAKKEDEEELRQRLKRLREEQQEQLADLDQLLQRMDGPENRSRLANARGELERTRAEAQSAAEALARGETARAVGASTRAERELERVRGELQRQVAQAFGEEMRQLRDGARRLDDEQKKIGEALARNGAGGPTPAAGTESRRLAASVERQKQETGRVLERMQKLTEAAEPSAPLLSRKLYDGLRQARIDDVERALERTGELLEHNLPEEARAAEEQARRGIADLKRTVDDAAKGVLGDEAEALRLAKSELDGLLAEAARERGSMPGRPGEPGPQGQPAQAGQPGQPGRPGEAGQQGQAGQGQQALAPAGQQGQAGQRGQPGQAGRPGQPGAEGPGRGSAGARGGGEEPGGAAGPGSGPGPGGGGPITGEGFRGWAERLRDVEDLLDDPDLRQQAARVRDRARALRADFKRHSEKPAFSLFDQQVLAPLGELRDRVNEELRRLGPEEKLAPIDRDPVPGRYSDLVRRYYKQLSEGK
jgi:hypothetical protein